MAFSNMKSIAHITRARITEVMSTRVALACSSFHVGHVTLCISSLYDSLKYVPIFILRLQFRTGGEARTPDTWFWRPVLYQLSYTRVHFDGNRTRLRTVTILYIFNKVS